MVACWQFGVRHGSILVARLTNCVATEARPWLVELGRINVDTRLDSRIFLFQEIDDIRVMIGSASAKWAGNRPIYE